MRPELKCGYFWEQRCTELHGEACVGCQPAVCQFCSDVLLDPIRDKCRVQPSMRRNDCIEMHRAAPGEIDGQ